jgi:hypothetical protein
MTVTWWLGQVAVIHVVLFVTGLGYIVLPIGWGVALMALGSLTVTLPSM